MQELPNYVSQEDLILADFNSSIITKKKQIFPWVLKMQFLFYLKPGCEELTDWKRL